MSEAHPYEAPSQSVFLTIGGCPAHLSMGGPILLIPVGSSGKTVAFEMHSYFGPIPVSKRTYDPLSNVPSGFWKAFELWEMGGKMVMENICVIPVQCDHCDGLGFMVDLSSGRAIAGPKCPKCDGKKCVHVQATSSGTVTQSSHPDAAG